MLACADEFLATVTEGVYKVVTQSYFGVTRQHKESGGKSAYRCCVITVHKPHTVVEGQGLLAQYL